MCDLKISTLQNFLLFLASFLPESPDSVKIPYIISQIDANAPWGTGSIIIELFSSSYDFLILLIAWKFAQFLLPMLINKL